MGDDSPQVTSRCPDCGGDPTVSYYNGWRDCRECGAGWNQWAGETEKPPRRDGGEEPTEEDTRTVFDNYHSRTIMFQSFRKAIENPREARALIRHRAQTTGLNPYRNACIWAGSRLPIGTPIWNRSEWDLLIVLDSCRADALRTLAPEYDFLDGIDTYTSVGGQTAEWLANTFDTEYADALQETTYITQNPHAETVLVNGLRESWDGEGDSHAARLRRFGSWNLARPDDLNAYEPLWRYRGDDYPYPPRVVTDSAIAHHRQRDPDRLLVHYMPPHTPYRETDAPEFAGSEFQYLRRTGDRDAVWAAYLDTLRWVLDDVELLLENIDADQAVVTSDHGEAFGEYGVYYHQAGSLHPYIRRVPWTTTTATDTGTHTPAREPVADRTTESVEESLEALGYLT